ncbi:SDR family oxidoreductase [Allostreptomyces psammosilenae]|uniref:3-oxoacyl-[acyl-carrier protein] reductase n=1 Tax=Allostreptomyces psammosilenae TaxID=1892865 RepID=A0A852ZPB5_9ACTN|nr:SDR family oxidoreductase [Allostreptomyces psammosilenae]NYI03317.1 3-oxoacyl-[acyl-carrier protein] reductase [Allostreptomyces psammosilenae]
MDLGLKDRVYIVTGGTRGLGFATARALVADGARVVVSGRTEEAAQKAATELGGGPTAIGVAADNADSGSAERLVATAVGRFERLDGVLISVGGPPAGALTAVEDDQWRDAFESVFLGAVRLARSAAEVLGEGGVIGFVLSGSARQPIPGLAISNGLRPGLAMAAKTLADELGPRGIRVIGLLPGRIDTDRVRELDATTGDATAAREQNSAGIPLRRYGAPEEFGRVAAFLLSPAASYVTGTMIPIDGGLLRSP